LKRTNFLRPKGIRNYDYNLLRGSNTRKQVIELRSTNLSMTLLEIANSIGISRQRVFKILREEGFPTKNYISIKKVNPGCTGNINGTIRVESYINRLVARR